MIGVQVSSTVVGSVSLALAGLSSLPAFRSLYEKYISRNQNEYDDFDVYEDGDGVATEKSQKEFSTLIPRSIALASSILGLFLSIACAAYTTVHPSRGLLIESWLIVASWISLVVQTTILFIVRNPLRRFALSLYGALTAFLIIAATCAENALLYEQAGENPDRYRVHIALIVTQNVLALTSLFSHLSVKRRPDVFDSDGRPIDGQFTGSVLNRMTFAWASPVLSYAKAHRGLNLEDLPNIAEYTRSNVLQQRFYDGRRFSRLWRTIVWNFRWAFFKQVVLVVTIGVVQFGPQWSMLHLLRLLEERSPGASVNPTAWFWVATLGLTMLFTSWVESWLFFTIWAELGIPIRALLGILVFSKATRRKDVKGVSNLKGTETEEPNLQGGGDSGPTNEESVRLGEDPTIASDSSKEKKGEHEEEDAQKLRQATINLVGVDAQRISTFCTFVYIFPGVATKLTVSMIFLNSLIGWKSLLAGLVTFAVSTPFNIWVSNNYNSAQSDLMKFRDQKMAVVTEALQGIRQIKFSALERQWQARIGEKREQELTTQWRVFKFDTALIGIWILGPVMLSAVSLTVYALLNGSILPSVAFTTIAILGQIEGTLAVIPELSTDAIDAWVSMNRIEDYLNAPEKVDNTTESGEVALENASIAWPSDDKEENTDRFVLRDLTLSFPRHELSVISGKTGSGKSLMLAALLGEVDLLEGQIKVPKPIPVHERYDSKATRENWIIDSNVAFVAQIPWIENATIKDNILFGLPFDPSRYKKVVSVCALEKDLDMLPDGELTDIGANGINLSGGQRWRVSFARALYSRAGILILDDIFSAVDAHVGRQLFEQALTGELGTGRTRILVTHHVGLVLPRTTYSVMLAEGTIAHAGLVTDLKKSGSLDDFLQEEKADEEKLEEKVAAAEEGMGDELQKVMSRRSERSAKIDDGAVDTTGKNQPKKFTEDEQRETGTIKLGVYKEYFQTSGGLKLWIPQGLFFTCYMLIVLGRSWWINVWTRSYETELTNAMHVTHSAYDYAYRTQKSLSYTTTANDDLWYYLGIYIGLSLIIVIIGTLRFLLMYTISIRASRILFEKLSYTVLRAPLRWLDTVPVGRVLNRFTADFNTIDSKIAGDIGFFFYECLQLIGITVAGLFVSPFMLLFGAILMLIAYFIASHYLYGAREVKRLESNAKSPVFEQFGTLLAGVGTVRAFDKSDEYIRRMYKKIDGHALSIWTLWLFNRWMGFRMNIVGATFAILVAAVVVKTTSINASLAGFALAFALQYTESIIWTLRIYASIEMNMNSTERVIEYSQLETEDQGGEDPPAAWPTDGRLELDGVVAGYAPELPPVLKNLSFKVERNERVGVVGRTGAGKSSLTLAIFRFLEAREGHVYIDGLDISKIKLHELRSRLAIIPQDPVLFSGTVRSNLDAFDEHTDTELRDALERVHLINSTGLASRDEANVGTPPTKAVHDTNTNVFKSLTSKISEGGHNLSQGQRQLLCLARAIVARPKIMVLDEATSAVDMATDVLIQRSIREEFQDSTLLVIAHRLTTIADFDKILVMGEGRALEFDTPKNLLEKKGVFWEMVGQSGEKERLEDIIRGAGEGSSGRGSGRGSRGGSGKVSLKEGENGATGTKE
ncbi:hypothetical protein MMC25_000114 [Agyrium rufum]|nr:hypothetical protein [Agyrium rufum]